MLTIRKYIPKKVLVIFGSTKAFSLMSSYTCIFIKTIYSKLIKKYYTKKVIKNIFLMIQSKIFLNKTNKNILFLA